MRIQHNIMAMNAYRNYTNNTSAVSKNLEKLSSGYKINRAGDDAAGLAISEKMRAQITGLNAAQKNVKDGISLVKTGEGAMQEIHDMLNRMTYLATQSANGTYDDGVDRTNLQKEVDSLKAEINRIADSANFNGINLLDGSMDSSVAKIGSSPITDITSTDAVSAGSSAEAFEATYVTNRPEAATKQTNAEFVVKLDDITFAAGTAGNHTITVKVGDATLTYTSEDATAMNTKAIRDALVKSGFKKPDAVTDTANDAVTGPTADKYTGVTNAGSGNKDSDAAANYIKIDGNIYKMSTTGMDDNEIKFTQVNFMGTSGKTVNPDYEVSITNASAATDGEFTGTVNDHVQKPVKGVGIGSTHQAQVDVTIDFSKLKDGDKLTVGDVNYVFKIGQGSTTKASTTDADCEVLVDLSSIFKVDSDMADEQKQADAMVAITKAMGAVVKDDAAGTAPAEKYNNTWSVGNGGLQNGKGVLTFQSLSSYDGDTVSASAAKIGGTNGTEVCDMRTEESVMKQFYAVSAKANATTSFNMDVTKLKEGDTVTINGTTYEFTSGSYVSDKNNVAIDLKSYGIKETAGGIHQSQAGKVLDLLKTEVNKRTDVKADFDGNKFTLTAQDDANSIGIDESTVKPSVTITGQGGALVLQIGATADSFNQLKVSIGDMHTKALGIDGIDISKQEGAQKAIDVIKDAINYVSGVRGDLGATQNRLEHTANNLSVMAENIQDAESTIRDTDIAEEMMAYTKNNILVQSAQAMLAQANQVPQGVLQLLG